jgi:hypothetical protein
LKFLFWVGVVFTIVAPIIIGIGFDDTSTSWVAALCGAFITFVSKLNEISELSLGPVKAKMKEKIDEVNTILQHLREALTVTSQTALTDLIAGGMIGGMSLSKRLELHENIIANLRAIGASDEQISLAERDWRKGISIVYFRTIQVVLEGRKSPNTVNFETPKDKKQASHEIGELLDFKSWNVPTPHQIRSVLTRHSIEDEDTESWINDYEHFLDHNEIRRREEFIAKREGKSQ